MVVTGPGVDLPDSPAEAVDRVVPDDPALIGMTSGTTAAPKGALLCHRHLLAATESLRWAWRWDPEDRLVHCLPLFHSHGLCVGAYGTMLSGASAVLLGAFDPARVAEAARRESATLFFGVPTMYHRLVTSGAVADLRGLRLCVSGSAPLSAATARRGQRRPGLARPRALRHDRDTDDHLQPLRRGTPGRHGRLPAARRRGAPGHDRRLRRPTRSSARSSSAVRTCSTATSGTRRPRRRPSSRRRTAVSRGSRTGDLGVVEEGSLVIRGRSKELIISGGYNVHPVEVEEALAACPGVADVAVSGTPSDEWGEVVTAWVVADGRPPTLEDLTRSVAASLAPYKRPRVVHIVDALPRNAMGKLVRSRLGTDLGTELGGELGMGRRA